MDDVVLTRWALVMADAFGTFLAGNAGRGDIRVSTAVVAFRPDGPSGPEARTWSGRRYVLLGAADPDNGEQVFRDVTGRRYDLRGLEVRSVAWRDALPMIAVNAAMPPPEEPPLPEWIHNLIVPDPDPGEDDSQDACAAANRALIKANQTASVARLVRERGLTTVEAAGTAGIDEERLRRIIDGDTGGLTIERLDRIIEALDPDWPLPDPNF